MNWFKTASKTAQVQIIQIPLQLLLGPGGLFVRRAPALLSDDETKFLVDNFTRWNSDPAADKTAKGTRALPTPEEAAKIPFKLQVNPETPPAVLTSLKIKNYIDKDAEGYKLAPKGHKLFMEWVTRLPNTFDKAGEMPDFNQLLYRAKRERTTFTTKKAKTASREHKPFNLRERRSL